MHANRRSTEPDGGRARKAGARGAPASLSQQRPACGQAAVFQLQACTPLAAALRAHSLAIDMRWIAVRSQWIADSLSCCCCCLGCCCCCAACLSSPCLQDLYVGNLSHRTALIKDQLEAGMYMIKRVAFFLRKVATAKKTCSVELNKFSDHELEKKVTPHSPPPREQTKNATNRERDRERENRTTHEHRYQPLHSVRATALQARRSTTTRLPRAGERDAHRHRLFRDLRCAVSLWLCVFAGAPQQG